MTRNNVAKEILRNRYIYILILPAIVYFLIFFYIPIIQGFVMSLQKYQLSGNSPFIGLEHYKYVLVDPDFWKNLKNTLVIGGGNLVIGFTVQVVLALLLNEIGGKRFKRLTQTIIYLPNLFSWVVVGGIWISLFSPDNGLVNELIRWFGGDTVYFMTREKYAYPIFILINTWKSAGYGCIIFLASIANINPSLYEAACIDGAGKWQQAFRITIPSLYNTMKVVLMLNLMDVLKIFDQSYVMTNPAIMDKTEVVMTYTYKLGILRFKLDYASAVAFIVLGMTLVIAMFYQLTVKSNTLE